MKRAIMMLSREVKRVPLNFSLPVGEIWYGYLVSFCLESEEFMHHEGSRDPCLRCQEFGRLAGFKVEDSCPEFPRYEPPTGEGYQMWETISEGSPISPVFSGPEPLAEWLSSNRDIVGKKFSKEDWLGIINNQLHGMDIATSKLV